MATLLQDLFKQSVEVLSNQQLFYGHGVEVAEDEVVLLLMHVLQMDFATLNTQADHPVTEAQIELANHLMEQRIQQRMPMAYVVGFAIFAGLRFKVDQRVLIPRSPFVELIDLGFQPWMNLNQPSKVMDLCCGSGCIGLAIAHYFTAAQVDLVDLSEAALELALENARDLQLTEQVRTIQSDLFNELDGPYDLIAANPPYVDEGEYQELPEEFSHEPKMALVSQKNGMELPVKILAQAADYLADNGYLFLEVGYNDEVLAESLPDVPFEWLDFSLGGQGICVFSRHDLLKYRTDFMEFLQTDVT